MRSVLLFLFFLFSSTDLIAHEPSGKQLEIGRPEERNPYRSFQTCQTHIENLISRLNCKVPPVLYGPGLSPQKNFEFGVQFYAARSGVSFERLNTLISLTSSEEGRKKLAHFFTGLKCAGLPGDPLERSNWTSYLPSCPEKAPKSPPWYQDSKWANAAYHPGSSSCFRLAAQRPSQCAPNKKLWECIGKKWIDEIPESIAQMLKDNVPSQQCCYDSDKKFILEGVAAGTPDLVFKSTDVEEQVEQHFRGDLSKLPKEKLAAFDHHILDARIISACFSGWPGKDGIHVKFYQALGWTPYRP